MTDPQADSGNGGAQPHSAVILCSTTQDEAARIETWAQALRCTDSGDLLLRCFRHIEGTMLQDTKSAVTLARLLQHASIARQPRQTASVDAGASNATPGGAEPNN